MRIAVAGATGRVGHHVVDVLAERGHDVVPIARSLGVDVITGEGLAEALAGADAIVDAATWPTPDEDAATGSSRRPRTTCTRPAGGGRPPHGGVSIIGADQFGGGYGKAKIAHEQATLGRPDPEPRAAGGAVPRVRGGARRMGPAGRRGLPAGDAHPARRRPDRRRGAGRPRHRRGLRVHGGGGRDDPRDRGAAGGRLPEAARLLVARRGDDLRIEVGSDPADPFNTVYTSGALLPGPDATLAGPTYAEWLESHVAVAR